VTVVAPVTVRHVVTCVRVFSARREHLGISTAAGRHQRQSSCRVGPHPFGALPGAAPRPGLARVGDVERAPPGDAQLFCKGHHAAWAAGGSPPVPVLFLACDDSSFFTGNELFDDGGSGQIYVLLPPTSPDNTGNSSVMVGDGRPGRYAGVMLSVKLPYFWRNSANSDSVRDRGVGGSNPLAPTNFLRKPAESRLPGHSVPLANSIRGTECSVLQIRASSRIVRDFSLPSLANRSVLRLFHAKGYPQRYPRSRRTLND
jgi:hypothetical protein